MLYSRVTESRAKTLRVWWQIASPILARVLTAQHRCGFGVGCVHQEDLLALARRVADTVDGPWPGGIGETLALRREEQTISSLLSPAIVPHRASLPQPV